MPEFKGPIKPTEHFNDPNKMQIPKSKKNLIDYSPSNWNEYFDKLEYLDNVREIYLFVNIR